MTNEAMNWDEVPEYEESFSQEDLDRTKDITIKKFVGKALCEVTKSEVFERNYDYPFMEVQLTLTIRDVLEAEMIVFDKDKKPIKRNGEILKKVRELTTEERAEANSKFVGTIGGWEKVRLYHRKEEGKHLDQRVHVAQNIQLTDDAKNLKNSDWQHAVGKRAIVSFELNSWYDKKEKVHKERYRVVPGSFRPADQKAEEEDFDDI